MARQMRKKAAIFWVVFCNSLGFCRTDLAAALLLSTQFPESEYRRPDLLTVGARYKERSALSCKLRRVCPSDDRFFEKFAACVNFANFPE